MVSRSPRRYPETEKAESNKGSSIKVMKFVHQKEATVFDRSPGASISSSAVRNGGGKVVAVGTSALLISQQSILLTFHFNSLAGHILK